jgi:dipicolinate synthase subunit A
MEATTNTKFIPLMEDMEVILPNAIVTVEGIIKNLIDNSEVTIYGSRIIVVGYGNVGKRLVTLLDKMGANIKVAVKEEADYFALSHLGLYAFYSKDIKHYLEHADIVVNTAPNLVLDKDNLDCLNKEAYVLDIASLPGGIDHNYATKIGIKNNHALGIPGQIAPVTAGRILSDKIDQYIRR